AVLDSKNKNKLLAITENGYPIKYSYKQISEMYYSSYYALAINKEWNIKHDIITSDSPDIIFVNETNENDRVAIEIYEAFNFKDSNTRKMIDIESEVKKLHDKKGNKKYDITSRLLIINRVKSTPSGYNVDEYYQELIKYSWNFSHIILCLFRQKENDFTFFYVYPKNMQHAIINFILHKDSNFLY
ncbi:MAG: hypothetical protein V1685_01890, partial [Parcubacteria group bacterium]